MKSNIFFSTLLVALFVLSSCNKEESIVETTIPDVSEISLSSEKLIAEVKTLLGNIDELEDNAQTRALMNYGNFTVKAVDYDYRKHYNHWYEFDLWPGAGIATSYNLCGPTSYMVATRMVAKENGHYYPANANKLKDIYFDLYARYGYPVRTVTSVSQLHYNSRENEGQYVTTYQFADGSRSAAKDYIKNTLEDGYPIIMPVNINAGNRNYHSNDSHSYNLASTNYYIDEDGDVGHYIIPLYHVLHHPSEVEYLFYKDVYTGGSSQYSSALKSVNFERALDANKAISQWNAYSALKFKD